MLICRLATRVFEHLAPELWTSLVEDQTRPHLWGQVLKNTGGQPTYHHHLTDMLLNKKSESVIRAGKVTSRAG